MGGHAGSGDYTGNPELSEHRVSQGRPSGVVSHGSEMRVNVLFVSAPGDCAKSKGESPQQ